MRRNGRAGLTLVELLVVVIILTTLVAAALPVMAPNSETRRLREATRSLQTAITEAQTKATELGRPYGIWLEKQSAVAGSTDPRDMGAVLTVHFCEEPAPFSGFSAQSRVILARKVLSNGNPDTFDDDAGCDCGDPIDQTPPRAKIYAIFGSRDPVTGEFIREPLPPAMFRAGDRLVIGHEEYELLPQLTGPCAGNNNFINPYDQNTGFLIDNRPPQARGIYLVARTSTQQHLENPCAPFSTSKQGVHRGYLPIPGNPQPLPPALSVEEIDGVQQFTYPEPYVIRRQPQKTGDPLQLPGGTAIDLEASGDRSSFFHDPLRPNNLGGPNNNTSPVVVLFAPGGEVHSVIRDDGVNTGQNVVQSPSDGSIYLLVGRRERTGESLADPRLSTWLDLESLWVGIAPQTGRVVTEENHPVGDAIALLDSTSANFYDGLARQRRDARTFARQSQGLGGR